MTDTKRAAIYARVSSDEQNKNYSLPTQVENGDQYASQHAYDVVARFKEDYTGTALVRPELDKVLKLASDGAIDVLIVYEIDRLARGLAKQIILEEDFRKRGVSVEYVLADYGDNPEGRLQKNVRATIAEYEREKFLQRSRRGALGRVKAGYVLPGYVAPYGYKYVPDPAGHKGVLIIVESEAAIIRLIFMWYVVGDETGKRLGTLAIASKLTAMRIPTRIDDVQPKQRKADGRPAKRTERGVWCKRTINNILHNETYAGTWYYDKTMSLGNGKRAERDRSEWLAIKVDPIVSCEQWHAAQQQMKHNTIHSPRRTKESYLMRGRLKCATCGRLFSANTDSRRSVIKRYYYCQGQKKSGSVDGSTITCNHSLRVECIDALVIQGLKIALRNPEMILSAVGQDQAEREKVLTIKRSLLATAESEIATREDERTRLLRRYLAGKLTEEALDAEEQRITKELAALTADRDTLQGEITDVEISAAQVQSVKEFCHERRNGLDHFTFEDWQDTIDLMNAHATVVRGQTFEEDVLLLEGYFPTLIIEAGSGNIEVITHFYRDRKTAVPFRLILKVSELAA